MTEFMKGKKDLQPSCSCLIECACLERQVPVWPGGELDKKKSAVVIIYCSNSIAEFDSLFETNPRQRDRDNSI